MPFGLKIVMPAVEELEELLPGHVLMNVASEIKSTGLGFKAKNMVLEAEKNQQPVRPKQLLVDAIGVKTESFVSF